jgi:hypothetical protein
MINPTTTPPPAVPPAFAIKESNTITNVPAYSGTNIGNNDLCSQNPLLSP